MTQPLNDFISQVRLADTIEDERFIISTEKAQIRAYIKKMDPTMAPRVISKLVFLETIGENPAWGQMEAIGLMDSDRFSYKRIGYICTSVLLDQTTEMSVLVTQTLLSDLDSSDPFVQQLALTFIANIGTPEVCRAVSTKVKNLLESNNPAVMKKAGMATVRIIRENPDLSESYKNSVQSLLNSNNHGIVNAGINLVIAMIEKEPRLIKAWAQFTGPFTKILKTLNNSRPTREFTFGIFNDPFMQVKTMKAIALLRKKNDELEGILQQIISSAEARRNTGRTVLYQTVETICSVSKQASLRGLAFNQVGRLLTMKDPNVLYSALSVFARILYNERTIINRGSVDSMALQRYKSQITKCLNHKDPSIRRRALDVISALIDENNAESLIPEILTYIKLADSDFRSELVAKIYTATVRFAPNEMWRFDTIHQILIDSGNYVSMEIITSFCESISRSPSLHQHAIQKLSESIINFSENQCLMQVAAFVVGEFAASDVNQCFESLSRVILMPQTTTDTKLYSIMAIAKMSTRFSRKEEAYNIFQQLSSSNELEVQQRSGEMMKLITHADVCDEMLAPIQETAESGNDNQNKQSQDNQQSNQTHHDIISNVLNQGSSSQQNTTDSDLLGDLLSPLQNSSQTPNQTSNVASSAQDLLGDLLSDTLAPAKPNPNPIQTQMPVTNQPAPVQQQQIQQPQAAVLLKADDFIIYGQAKYNIQDKRQIALKLLIYGTTNSQFSGFNIEFQPSVGWKVNHQPPDSKDLLPATSQKPISQLVYLLNMNNSPFQLRLKITYKFGSQPLNFEGIVSTLPPMQ